jgi:putative ABC transport system ATP-binding protein
MLKMTNVSKIYRTELIETHALRDMNLHVKEGEFIFVKLL